MDKVIKNKKGLELVTSRSSGHETSSEKFPYSLYITLVLITGFRAGLTGLNLGYPENPALNPIKPS